jgi:hypothetical protein
MPAIDNPQLKQAAALVAEKLKRVFGQLEQQCAGAPSTVDFAPTK